MWCYKKPGFEALLLTELQRQQQCSQFCDTLLKTEGVSVPAHSCILSALSPHISSALSSTPPPPAGQNRLLEFRALGACTLPHMVRLLYCGEMAGEGEMEKQEAISAAAKLGIHGLVEVTRRDQEGRNEEGWRAEVGVQTEPLMPEENEGRRGRWKREVTDESTFLWKEKQLDGRKDTWTQTEQLQLKSDPPSYPAASFETIDMKAFQGLGQTDSHLAPLRIPYIPISLLFPSDENQVYQPSSALVDSMQESTAAGHTAVAPPHAFVPPALLPFSSHVTSGPADLQSWWAGLQGATREVTAAEEWGDERLEHFQGNIPGYISYFLNPDKKEGFGRGRARRRPGAGVGGARRAATGERRARRPRARTGGRGRGGLTQTVDVQDVGVSRLQKLFLQRWGPSRAGQGGGAVGRKLYLKTRELLKSAKSSQRRRGRGKVWEFSQSGDVPLHSDGGGGGNTQQFNQLQDGLPVGRARRARAKPTAPVSFSSPNIRFYNVLSPTIQPSPSPGLQSPAASYVPPPSSLLLSTSLPPPAPPPHEEPPEHFDRLLEEVMMGLDILPNNAGAPHSQPPPPTGSSSYTSCGDAVVQNKHHHRTAGLLEASPGFHGATQVVAKSRGDVSAGLKKYRKNKTNRRSQITELQLLLDFILCVLVDCALPWIIVSGGIQYTAAESDEAETLERCSQPRKTSARRAAPPKNTEESPVKVKAPAKKRKKRRKNEYLLSLERKRVRVSKPVSSSDVKTKDVHDDKRDKQLQQRAVVKLESRGQLPARVTLQKHSCLQVKTFQRPEKAKTSSASVKDPRDSFSTKTYPIRSRFTDAHILDSSPFLEEPLQMTRTPAEGRANCSRDKPNRKVQLLSLFSAESSTVQIQPQPLEPCGTEEPLEKDQERHEGDNAARPQEEAEGATKRGGKRGAESEEVTSDESTASKRICFEQMTHSVSETFRPSPQSADSEPATREIKDISLTSVRPHLQIEDRESLMDEEMEIIDVDGGPEDDRCWSRTAPTLSHFAGVTPSVSPSSRSAKEVCLRSTRSWEEDKDEDIDVIGGSSPVPEPVIISWTESSEGEEEEGAEDIDVVGEKTDYALSADFTTVSKRELVTRKYQTEVLLH
ncbi:uncharacterized protein LOC129090573 [Anoplopoma fimbria]|uniref:uncharacterized protein LOC129090573 n=1 Tax=Anoplopoma fimbria TaxID=229290 RepID=UPI0023EDF32B|nr:uncharacterized protein LOC129090573 [Anoplopoma fimbria]